MLRILERHALRSAFRLSISLLALAIALLGSWAGGPDAVAVSPLATRATVAAVVETEPVAHSGDAADDLAIWIHPTDPALSTIITTDKTPGREGLSGGLVVYDLAGRELQSLSVGGINNVDLRYNFSLGGQPTDLVVGGNKRYNSLVAYRVNPATRLLENITVDPRGIVTALPLYGTCMYRSPRTGRYYIFMTKSPHTDSPDNGEVEQWELFDNGAGKVDGRLVRTFFVGSDSEGCVADDVFGQLYVAQSAQGVWKYGAEPEDGDSRTLIASFTTGELSRGLEGVTLYYTSRETGYLIVSNQGLNKYVVYRRETGADGMHAHVTTFQIGAGNGIDAVTDTDGIDVTNVDLGPGFPVGVFVAQDGVNTLGTGTSAANQNFKLVSWATIATAAGLTLAGDTTWDPRLTGADLPPTHTPSSTATNTPTNTPSSTATNTPSSTATNTPSSSPVATEPPATATNAPTPDERTGLAPPPTPTSEVIKAAQFQTWLPMLAGGQ